MADEPGKTATLHTPGGELEMTIRPATEGASAFLEKRAPGFSPWR